MSCVQADISHFVNEEGGRNVLNHFLVVVGQSRSCMLVESFLEEEEELARTALSCHLAMDLLCQEMSDACWSQNCRKVGNDALK